MQKIAFRHYMETTCYNHSRLNVTGWMHPNPILSYSALQETSNWISLNAAWMTQTWKKDETIEKRALDKTMIHWYTGKNVQTSRRRVRLLKGISRAFCKMINVARNKNSITQAFWSSLSSSHSLALDWQSNALPTSIYCIKLSDQFQTVLYGHATCCSYVLQILFRSKYILLYRSNNYKYDRVVQKTNSIPLSCIPPLWLEILRIAVVLSTRWRIHDKAQRVWNLTDFP